MSRLWWNMLVCNKTQVFSGTNVGIYVNYCASCYQYFCWYSFAEKHYRGIVQHAQTVTASSRLSTLHCPRKKYVEIWPSMFSRTLPHICSEDLRAITLHTRIVFDLLLHCLQRMVVWFWRRRISVHTCMTHRYRDTAPYLLWSIDFDNVALLTLRMTRLGHFRFTTTLLQISQGCSRHNTIANWSCRTQFKSTERRAWRVQVCDRTNADVEMFQHQFQHH